MPETNIKYSNIPPELSTPPLWLQYYLSPDPKKPDKKPGKHPCVKYATPEDRKANLRSLDYLVENRQPQKNGGVQRWVDKQEGFVFVDIDHVRNPETGVVEQWAFDLVEELGTYCELSPSGTGFHLVARGTLPEDFHLDPNKVEIYSGNIPNKLIAMTGDIHNLHVAIEPRQAELDQLLRRAKAGEFNRTAPLPPATAIQIPPELVPPPGWRWRDVFHLGSELDSRPGKIFITGILEEGITSFGSLSGVGKTWIGLSISHALLSGEPLFGVFEVLERANVLYLVPEMGGRKFRERMVKMRISMDSGFFCQTIKDGACDLADPFLLQAVHDMQPVVILDTAIRFQAGDENSSTDQAQGLGARIFNLINHGAQAVICMHHRKKSVRNEETSLENALRGSGDFGAMSDCVWAVEHARSRKGENNWDAAYAKESEQLTRLFLQCVKPRDMEPADDFMIQGRPFIDQKGDFVVLASESTNAKEPESKAGDEKVLDCIAKDDKISIRGIIKATGFGHNKIARILAAHNKEQIDGRWTTVGEKEDEPSIF